MTEKGYQLTWSTPMGRWRLVVASDEVGAILRSIFRTYTGRIQVVIEELD